MSVKYPDIASQEGGLVLSNIQAVTIKCTQSTNYINPYFAGWKSQAAKIGAIADAYHYLVRGNGAAQAKFAFQVSGGMPMMVDIEKNPADSTFPLVSDVNDFISTYRSLGGRITKLYWAQWVWGSMGSPDLSGYGIPIVNANYSGGGWNSYGGITPTIVQFSETYSYNGYSLDFNEFKGTIDEYRTLIYGDPVTPPVLDEMEIVMQCNGNGEAALGGDELPTNGVAWVFIHPFATTLKLRPVLLLPTGPEVLDDISFDSTDHTNCTAAIHFEQWASSALALTVTRDLGTATYYLCRPK